MNTDIKPSPFRPRFAGRAAIVLADVAYEVVPWIPVALAVLIAAGMTAGFRAVCEQKSPARWEMTTWE